WKRIQVRGALPRRHCPSHAGRVADRRSAPRGRAPRERPSAPKRRRRPAYDTADARRLTRLGLRPRRTSVSSLRHGDLALHARPGVGSLDVFLPQVSAMSVSRLDRFLAELQKEFPRFRIAKKRTSKLQRAIHVALAVITLGG